MFRTCPPIELADEDELATRIVAAVNVGSDCEKWKVGAC